MLLGFFDPFFKPGFMCRSGIACASRSCKRRCSKQNKSWPPLSSKRLRLCAPGSHSQNRFQGKTCRKARDLGVYKHVQTVQKMLFVDFAPKSLSDDLWEMPPVAGLVSSGPRACGKVWSHSITPRLDRSWKVQDFPHQGHFLTAGGSKCVPQSLGQHEQ